MLGALSHCAHEGAVTLSQNADPFALVGDTPAVLILYVSDLHSQLRADKDGNGGYAQIATWIESEKAAAGKKTDVIVMAGGDLLGKGSLPCQISKDKECLPLLKDWPVDFATLGNHELYHSPSELKSLIQSTGARFVASNVSLRESGSTLQSWAASPIQIKAPKSGLSFWLYTWTDPFDVTKNYNFKRFPDSNNWLQLKNASSGDPILLMTHMELQNDLKLLKEACLNLTQSNQIIALLKSNDHQIKRTNSELCAQILEPGPFGRNGLKLLLQPVAGHKNFKVSSQFVDIKGFEENKAINEKIKLLYQKHAPDADEVLFNMNSNLKNEELAQWVADAYRIRTKADVGIVNLGYVKSGLDQGIVKKEEFFVALPYVNELMGIDWSKAELEKLLCERSRTSKDSQLDWGSELKISGLSLVNPGQANCKVTGSQKSSLKVVMDSYLVSRSSRWLGKDVTKQVFRFGVDSRRVSLLHIKDNPPQVENR